MPPLTTVAVDLHGSVTYWNAAAENLTGWMRDELGRATTSVLGPLVIVSKNGSVVEATLCTSVLRISSRTPRGALVVAAGNAALRDAPWTTCREGARGLAFQY
jgi:PAS domain-containing protein